MNWRRVAVALLAGGALLVPGSPASAETPRGAWTSPAPSGTHEGVPVTVLGMEAPLGGYAEFDGGIAGVSFSLAQDTAEPDDPCAAAEGVPPQQAAGGAFRVEFSFEASFPCNRRYLVRARIRPEERPLAEDSALELYLWVDVSIPPGRTNSVTAGLAGREVVVRWDPVVPVPDLQGYEIRRATGDGPMQPIGEVGPQEWEFVDRDVPAGGATFRYEVRAKRPGPGDTILYGEAGQAEATVVPPAPNDAPGPGAVQPGGGNGGGTVRRSSRPPTTRRTTPTTLDTGYQEALPFQPRTEEPVEPVGDPAVVARLPDVDDDDLGQRQTLLLIAGGTTAFSWAMLLRLLNRKAMVF